MSAQLALCNWPNDQEKETLKDLFIGRIRDVDVQQQLIKAKADLDGTFKLSRSSARREQVRRLSIKNYSLIINIQPVLRLNKNLLALFSRREGNGIILKIKIIDRRHKTIKQINHVTSVVILGARSTENLVQLVT